MTKKQKLDAFQKGEINFVKFDYKAGGVGVSYHEVRPQFQHVKLEVKIVPFNSKKSAKLYAKAWDRFLKQKKASGKK